jgi:hypothetical protein
MTQLSTGRPSREAKRAASLKAKAAAPPNMAPVVVTPREAGHMLRLGMSRIYRMMRSGELSSYGDSRLRRIPMTTIHENVARRLADSTGAWRRLTVAPPTRHRRQAKEARG